MSFPRYEAYKDSGVEWLGRIPSHWSIQELRYVCTNRPSNVDKKVVEGEQKVLLCNYTDVYYNEVITSEMELMRATATSEQIDRFTLKSGDVIITKDSETADDIAVSAYVPKDMPGVVCGYHLAMLRPHEGVSGKFIKRLFDSVYLRSKVATLANGLTRVGLSSGAISGLELPIPPASEQHAIASFLDRETSKIDALVSEQRRLVELLKEKRQAVISHAVTKGLDPTVPMKPSGIEWLGDVPEHWIIDRLDHLVDTRKGVAFKADDFTDDGVGVVKASDIKELTIRTPTTFLPQEFVNEFPKAVLVSNELVLSTVGSSPEVPNSAVGQLGRVPANLAGSLLNQNTVIFTPHEEMLTNDFLFYLIQTAGYRDHLDLHAHGTANQSSLIVSEMLNIRIPLPSPIEQSRIVECLDRVMSLMDELSEEANRAITLLQERRTALISAAVTGKIDVRGWVPEEPE
jgi:type I restriction enzyme S subunit